MSPPHGQLLRKRPRGHRQRPRPRCCCLFRQAFLGRRAGPGGGSGRRSPRPAPVSSETWAGARERGAKCGSSGFVSFRWLNSGSLFGPVRGHFGGLRSGSEDQACRRLSASDLRRPACSLLASLLKALGARQLRLVGARGRKLASKASPLWPLGYRLLPGRTLEQGESSREERFRQPSRISRSCRENPVARSGIQVLGGSAKHIWHYRRF